MCTHTICESMDMLIWVFVLYWLYKSYNAILGISNIHIKYILKSGINAKCEIQNVNYRQDINIILSHTKDNKTGKNQLILDLVAQKTFSFNSFLHACKIACLFCNSSCREQTEGSKLESSLEKGQRGHCQPPLEDKQAGPKPVRLRYGFFSFILE